MGKSTIQNLVETRKRVLLQVNQRLLAVDTAASILGISRQGLWKMRRRISLYGLGSIVGRKRGPKAYHRVWNRTPAWFEDQVGLLFDQTGGVGADRILWFLGDCLIATQVPKGAVLCTYDSEFEKIPDFSTMTLAVVLKKMPHNR